MAVIDVGTGYSYPASEAGIASAIRAAASGDTVYVHAATINIESQILINKSIYFRGESWDSTKFYLGPYAGGSPDIDDAKGAIQVTANNAELGYFQAWGPEAQKEVKDDRLHSGGAGDQRNAILVTDCSGCKIHNVNVKRFVYNDAIRLRRVTGSQVYDSILEGNHDTIGMYDCSNITVKNCKFTIAVNTGIRFYGSSNVHVSYVTVDGNLGGQSVFSMQLQEGSNSIDRCLIKHVNVPFFTYGQGDCVVSNTVICSGCNANCSGTNITSGANPDTTWSGYGYNGASNPPTESFVLSSISPSSHAVGEFTVTISGTKFDTTALPQFYYSNGTYLGVGTVQSGQTSTKIVDAVNLSADDYTVKVKNANGTLSNGVTLHVYEPSTTNPTISYLSPNEHVEGEFTVTINGSNFDASALPQFYTSGGTNLGQGTVQSGQTSSKIVTIVTLNPDTYTVKVKNGNGTTSGNATLKVTSAAVYPSISSISPTNGKTNAAFNLTINGSNFSSATPQIYNSAGTMVTTGTVQSGQTSSQIITTVSLTVAGTYTVKVKNSDGNESGGVSLAITEPVMVVIRFGYYQINGSIVNKLF